MAKKKRIIFTLKQSIKNDPNSYGVFRSDEKEPITERCDIQEAEWIQRRFQRIEDAK